MRLDNRHQQAPTYWGEAGAAAINDIRNNEEPRHRGKCNQRRTNGTKDDGGACENQIPGQGTQPFSSKKCRTKRKHSEEDNERSDVVDAGYVNRLDCC